MSVFELSRSGALAEVLDAERSAGPQGIVSTPPLRPEDLFASPSGTLGVWQPRGAGPSLHASSGIAEPQATLVARAREAFAQEFGLFDIASVAAFFGESAAAEAENAWGAMEAVAVLVGLDWAFPGFQFADGHLISEVRRVVRALRQAGAVDWSAAFWFSSANGWLGFSRPVDILRSEPQAVVTAARRELDPNPA